MQTKDVIEGLLYLTTQRKMTIECLKACHVLNDTDRNWQPVQHTEFHFLDDIKYCSYLMIVDKQVHVFLIGERSKGRTYIILDIEGFTCDLLTMSKGELIKYIKDGCKENEKLYLPESFGQRIVFIKPEYINGLTTVYIFNRQTLDSNMFRKSMWNFGTDIYSVGNKEYETKADDILREIMKDLDDDE